MARRHIQLERVFKGMASHRRIEILELLERSPGMSLKEVVLATGTDYRTAAEHVRKLALAGLIWKDRRPRTLALQVSDRGKAMLGFAATIAR